MGSDCSCMNQTKSEGLGELSIKRENVKAPEAFLESEKQESIAYFPLLQSAARGYLVRRDLASNGTDLESLVCPLVLEIESSQGFYVTEEIDENLIVKHKKPIQLKDGTTYIGELNSKKKPNGVGIQVHSDGSKYVGQFRDGQKQGKGRLISSNGDVYEGGFSEGKAEGLGKFIRYSDKATYKGEFKDDKQDGHGKEVYSDGAYYEGEYSEGIKHGKGKFIWKDGSFYEGEVKNNKLHGKGKYVWGNGKKYKGEWENGCMQGKGRFKWKDGRVYKGEYLEDKKHGYGEFYWPDGKVYKGYWEKGQQCGYGVLEYRNKNNEWKQVEGQWLNGKRVKNLSKD